MSPIEYIAKGIHEGNWEIVCEGYKKLTGKSLPLPKSIVTDEAAEALQQIVGIASSVLNRPIAEIDNKPTTKKPGRPRAGEKKKKTMKNRKDASNDEDPTLRLDDSKKTSTTKEAGGIQFITNDPDPEEIEKNRTKAERAKKNKIRLGRKTARKYKVNCNECGKTFESDRSDGEMGQKCPQCLREKKSRFI